MRENPPWWGRCYAWVLISLISFFFAEIISGSSMIRSFDPGALAISFVWALVITIPVYGLHTIVLAWIVYRFSKPRLYTLFFAGIIFGLYEAYLTKVIWVGWGPDTVWFFGGVAVVETATLLLFWHPFMAFIIPLFASESILARSREVLSGLPQPLQGLFSGRKRIYVTLFAFALICGVSLGGQTASSFLLSPLYAIVSALLAFVVFTPLFFVYRRLGLHKYTMRQLLPTRRELVILLIPLALIYLVMGIFIRPEALRNILPQVIVWLMYAAATALLFLSMRKSKRVERAPKEFSVRLTKKLYLAFFAVLILASALISLIPSPDIKTFFVLVILLAGTAIGAVILARSIIDLGIRE